MKYIVVKKNRPVLFLDSWAHDEMAFKLGVKEEVTSAGFVTIVDGKLLAYGESVSLGIASKEEDSELIKKLLHH